MNVEIAKKLVPLLERLIDATTEKSEISRAEVEQPVKMSFYTPDMGETIVYVKYTKDIRDYMISIYDEDILELNKQIEELLKEGGEQ